ncbi:hypothetical protein ACFGVR_15535 [Mucilaginibacter sp. AW1-3]
MNRSFDYLLFLAEPFGFGPISSSIAIVRQVKLLKPEIKCFFLGSGTSYQLATKSNVFDEVGFCELLSEQSLAECYGQIDPTNCIIIANTYPNGIRLAKQIGFKAIFVDTLFWMWKELPIHLSDVEKYYIEDFYCTDIALDRFCVSDKFILMPPLIDIGVEARQVPHPFLLISFGGIDSNLYDFPIFYQKLIATVSANEKLKNYNIMICGGGKKFRENEFKVYETSRVVIKCLEPYEYISYLKAADIVVASAGLHSFYENYFLRKNVMFLPPQSYSQYLQLKYIMENFEGVSATNFEQLGIKHSLRENMPDEERISEVKRINKLMIDTEVWETFFNVFEEFYRGQLRTDWSIEKQTPERNLDGPRALAKEILSFIIG